MKITNITFYIIIIAAVFSSCKPNEELKEAVCVNLENVEAIEDYKDVIAKQEIIELSNVDGAYMTGLDRIFVSDSIYLFITNNTTVYLFDGEGNFISNSSDKIGNGNKEYSILLGATYNKYSGNVEVLTPFGIMFYDRKFNYVGKSKYSDKEAKRLMFNYIYDLSSHEHILLSPLDGTDKESYMYVYDSKERKIIHKARYEKECAFITMQEQCVSDGNFIAFPSMNYSFYDIDLNNYELKKCVSLDLGDKKLKESDYSHLSDIHQRRKFLSNNCKKSLALRTFKSGNRVVSMVRNGNRLSYIKTYIVDLDNAKGRYLKYQYEKMRIPMFDAFYNGVLYACISESNLEKCVDMDLLDEKSKEVLARRSEESNYYIIKYYLK